MCVQKNAWGNSGIAVAQELPITGRIFRNSSFTEIIVGWEVRDAWETNDLSIFYQGLRRLLFTYRYLSPDLRARLSPALKGDLPAIRVGFCKYSGPRAPTALDRIRDNEPLRWAMNTMSVREYVSGIAGQSGRFGKIEERTNRLGSFLMRGFVLPETIAALEMVADEVFVSHNYRCPYRAKAGCATSTGSRRTRLAPSGMLPALSWS